MLCLCACTPLEPEPPILQFTAAAPVPTQDTFVTYQDLQNKFELKYSAEDYSPDSYKYPGEAFALLLDVNTIFVGNNLEGVRVNVAANPVCLSLDGYGLTASIEDVSINGIDFTKYSERDAGTHSLTFEHTTYQTQHAHRCYEITVSVREYLLDVSPNLTEYSKDLLTSKLDPLIQTFRFLD